MLEIQIRMREFCSELIEVAIQTNEKSRNIDTLRTCESKLREELSQDALCEIQKKIEYILLHMNQSAIPSKQIADSEEVTQQEVQNRIRQILAECMENGEQMKRTYAASGTGSVHKVKESISDYVYVEANYETMCNSERLQEQCTQLALNYDLQIQKLGTELIESVTSIYCESIKHIEKMIMSVGRGAAVNTVKELYIKWDGHVAQAEDSVKQQAVTLDSGKSQVVQFAERCQPFLQKIKRKNKRKRIWMKFCPILFLILFIAGFVVYGQIKDNQNVATTQIEEKDDSFVGQIREKVKDLLTDQIADKLVSIFDEKVMQILIPLLILLGFAYIGWNMYVQKVFHTHMVQEIGQFMNGQVNEFVASNKMESIQSEYFAEIARQLHASYGELIMSIFNESVTTPLEKSSNVILDMESQWVAIKNMREI